MREGAAGNPFLAKKMRWREKIGSGDRPFVFEPGKTSTVFETDEIERLEKQWGTPK
ncbi:hypothetical protein [Chryseobacterium schmidteae]|uniref:hypothetical protein n=1 Tax=Chryseobacterium schmidteae TaxID=2730404 RepID=UPI00158DB0A4|nr:hypothetical protein [Chryseobacterium schmidteae]